MYIPYLEVTDDSVTGVTLLFNKLFVIDPVLIVVIYNPFVFFAIPKFDREL